MAKIIKDEQYTAMRTLLDNLEVKGVENAKRIVMLDTILDNLEENTEA